MGRPSRGRPQDPCFRRRRWDLPLRFATGCRATPPLRYGTGNPRMGVLQDLAVANTTLARFLPESRGSERCLVWGGHACSRVDRSPNQCPCLPRPNDLDIPPGRLCSAGHPGTIVEHRPNHRKERCGHAAAGVAFQNRALTGCALHASELAGDGSPGGHVGGGDCVGRGHVGPFAGREESNPDPSCDAGTVGCSG